MGQKLIFEGNITMYIYIYINHYSDIYRYRYMNIDKEPSGIILNMGNISPWHKARTRAQGQGSDFLVRKLGFRAWTYAFGAEASITSIFRFPGGCGGVRVSVTLSKSRETFSGHV